MWFNSDLINAYRNSIAGQKDILMHVVNLPGLLGINHFWSKAIARTSCVPLWAVTKGKPWALRATEQTLKHILYYVYIHIHLYTYIHVLYYIILYYIIYMHSYSVSSVMSDSLQPIWTVAHQAPLSMELSRQEYWSGLLVPSPGDLPNPGIKPNSPALQEDSLTYVTPGKPSCLYIWYTFIIYIYICIYCIAYTYICMLHVIYAFAFFSFGSLLKLQAPGRNFCFAHCCIPNAYNRFLRYIRTSINIWIKKERVK